MHLGIGLMLGSAVMQGGGDAIPGNAVTDPTVNNEAVTDPTQADAIVIDPTV